MSLAASDSIEDHEVRFAVGVPNCCDVDYDMSELPNFGEGVR